MSTCGGGVIPRSLPDLISRLLLDRSQFQEGIAASIKDVAGLDAATSKGASGLLSLGNAHTSAGGSAKKHAAEVKNLESSLRDAEKTVGIFERTLGALGASGETGIGRAAQQLSGVTSNLGPAGAAIGLGLGGTAALAGVAVVLDHLAESQANYGFKTLQTSQALGVESGELQGLEKWGERFGIQTDTMDTQLFRFNKNLAEGAPTLKAQGISLQELGITSKDTATAYGQTADALAKVTDAQQKALIVQSLFGRGGEQQLQAMQQGSGAITDYIRKLEDYGVILDKNTLQQDAVAKSAREDMGLAFQGLENTFVAPLEQGFTALDIVITKMATNGKNGIQSFGQTVANVVGDVASLLNGLFGLGITQEDLNAGFAEEAKNAQTAGGAFAYQATKVKDVTAATQEQVKELQRQQQAYDAGIEQANRNDEALSKELDLRMQLRKENETAAADGQALAKDQATARDAIYSGDFAGAAKVNEQITKDKQKSADDQAQFGIDAQKREIQARIDARNEERRVTDETFKDRIQKLQDELTAVKDANAAAVNDTAQTGQHVVALTVGTTATLNDKWTGVGARIKSVLSDPFSDENKTALVNDAVDLGNAVGQAFGREFTHGILTATVDSIERNKGIMQYLPGWDLAVKAADSYESSQRHQTGSAAVATDPSLYGAPAMNDSGHRGYASGGILSEPVFGVGRSGRTYSFAEQGPERILSAPETAGGRGATVVHNHFEFPNYIGDRADLEAFMHQAVARAFP